MNYTIRDATSNDVNNILPLLPRLADFEIPAQRTPEHLWQGDAELLKQWGRGEAPHCIVKVAVADPNTILGTAIITLREELLSHQPSAHLEVLVIAKQADGHGLGKALLQEVEKAAREQGVLSMSLHVFVSNTRARYIYEKLGYEEELMRHIKHFE